MGRSSTQQARHNRTRIVEVASRLFREHGVDAVSVSDIMAAAGMTVGGFYKHFSSKEALADEAAAFAFEDAAKLWSKVLGEASGTSSEPRVQLVEQYLRPNPQRHCPIISFAPYAAGKEGNSSTRGAYETGTGALLATFAANEARDLPTPGEDKPDQKILLLFAAMIGARVMGEAAGDADWVDAIKKAVIERAGNE
ncbi:TetR family transcriptional regulator [Roseivivax marinus]|uniref:TetR family transcriptional regulator n=1 Tax=Roseivivax marinus TaxID=1379903 RepID=W4HF79_9RHOB|nr:TetR family transcriptional regulator [Roseivivax marinus]ETW10801.1 TetR family transcriptional regulator [Roseivivax marinus]